jgi:periplasmic protein TonB
MIAELAVGRAAEHRKRVRVEPTRSELEGRGAAVPRPRRPSVSERRGRERRLLLGGLVLSVAIHAAVILTVSVRPLDWTLRSESRTSEAIQLPVLQAVELAPAHPAPAPEREQQEAIPVAASPTPAPTEREIPMVAAAVPVLPVEPVPSTVATDSQPVQLTAAPMEDSAERGRYEQDVAHWVERQRNYPLAARQRRLEGTAIVRIQVDGDGALLDARLVRDTGHAMLDRAALDMIHRAAPYPRVPRSLSSAPVEVLVPIQFTLSR